MFGELSMLVHTVLFYFLNPCRVFLNKDILLLNNFYGKCGLFPKFVIINNVAVKNKNIHDTISIYIYIYIFFLIIEHNN